MAVHPFQKEKPARFRFPCLKSAESNRAWELFHTGHDTADIAVILGESEAAVANALHWRREAGRLGRSA